jgi:thioredoxin-dependent peroxiredoxin
VEGQGFRDRAPEFEEMEAEILGISFDTPEANDRFAEKFLLPFRLLSDPDRSVGERYETKRHPDEKYPESPKRRTYLIDPNGIIRKAYRVTHVDSHPVEVLEDLRALR